jgi:hypothetical protein
LLSLVEKERKMEPPGALFNTGSSVGTRAESVQVNNGGSNLYWYTETVYSRNRDISVYPTASSYVSPLSRTYKRVLEVELLTAQIPISTYNVETYNNLLDSHGNNCFRFNEGYIIDNGLFGIYNDRVQVKEYSNPLMVVDPRMFVEPFCCVSEARLPHTLTPIDYVREISDCLVEVFTKDCHYFTTKYCPVVYVMDNSASFNGKYNVIELSGPRSFKAKRLPFQTSGGSSSSFSRSQSSSSDSRTSVGSNNNNNVDDNMYDGVSNSVVPYYEQRSGKSSFQSSSEGNCGGWVYWPRVSSPHILANMVQDYLNERSSPPVRNRYSMCFNDNLGQFVFTRATGLYLFDMLAKSDERSIFSATMGFSSVDYLYGQYSGLTRQQSTLPSDMLMESVRPDIKSETCGESAEICLKRGNYLPTGNFGLDTALTREMQRPLVIKCKNDTLVVQLMGQIVNLTIPQGMYDPQNLIDCICREMTDAFARLARCQCDENTFCGTYNMTTGRFTIASKSGEIFGLLFSQSTIGYVIGFETIDLTGGCIYQSQCVVFFPINNCRFTDQIYQVVAQENEATFRFIKTGAFQAPIVHVERVGDCAVRVYTWTKETGGCAHGFQSGDIMTIEGPCGGSIVTEPPFHGMHVVERVFDAFSFQLGLSLEQTSTYTLSTSSSKRYSKDNDKQAHGQVDSAENGSESVDDEDEGSVTMSDRNKKSEVYVASHWFQPFCLFFSGFPNSIGDTLGFPFCVSGCVDYVGPLQWNLSRRQEVYINIQQLNDTDYGRICKTSDSGPNSKYVFKTLNSFVRIPLSSTLQGLEFGILASSSFSRRKRFTFNSVDLSEVKVSIVDACGNLLDFHGREHSFDLRILVEQ